VAFVIVSAGRLTDSRLLTLPARTVLIAAGIALLFVMAACVGLGYRLAAAFAPTAAVAPEGPERPEVRALVEHIGSLAGRLVQLESKAAALAQTLGAAPLATTLHRGSAGESSGGPLVPLQGVTQLETELERLEGAMTGLAAVAVEHDVEAMAFPNRLPVAAQALPVSSSFGTRRDPFTGRLARHSGLDIPAPHGAPILASGGGRVVSAGYRGAYGQAVVIDHGDGLTTLYGHASRLLVRPGDVVMPQQKIALVGSTGRSTGPHLHFEVIRDGRRVEPRQYLVGVLEPAARTAVR
jgi:murein DD-endopeptidase MepM/ murein hydrolase activator NlpD